MGNAIDEVLRKIIDDNSHNNIRSVMQTSAY